MFIINILFIFYLLLEINVNVYAKSDLPYVISQGSLSCLMKGETSSTALSCELSTACALDEYVFSANDHESNLIYLYKIKDLIEKKEQREILPLKKIILPDSFQVSKIESSTVFNDWVFLVGSYITNDEPGYSKIMAFKFDLKNMEAKDFQVVAEAEIREKIQKALKDFSNESAQYFKIEASAIIPGDNKNEGELLLGIRVQGKGYHEGEFSFHIKILSTQIKINEAGKMTIGPDFKVIYDMSKDAPGEGISDLSFDKINHILYMTTSIENNEKYAGSLWKISLQDFKNNKNFVRIEDSLFKGHKPEGVTITKNNQIVIIADEDKAETSLLGRKRKRTEAPYWVLDLNTLKK